MNRLTVKQGVERSYKCIHALKIPIHHGGTMLVKLVMLVVLLLTVGDVLPVLAQLEGTQVSRIFVRTHTADEGNAGTDADVYLGFGGRELVVANPREGDRDRNEVDMYRFGDRIPTW